MAEELERDTAEEGREESPDTEAHVMEKPTDAVEERNEVEAHVFDRPTDEVDA
jgi:hypothetical protein